MQSIPPGIAADYEEQLTGRKADETKTSYGRTVRLPNPHTLAVRKKGGLEGEKVDSYSLFDC